MLTTAYNEIYSDIQIGNNPSDLKHDGATGNDLFTCLGYWALYFPACSFLTHIEKTFDSLI